MKLLPRKFVLAAVILLGSLAGFLPALTYAQVEAVPRSDQFNTTGRSGLVPCGNYKDDPCTVEDIFNVIVIITNYLIGLASIIVIISIVYAGFSMVAAAGNQGSIEDAKKRLSNSIIGLVLILLAFIMINTALEFISGKSGFDLLNKSPHDYVCTDSKGNRIKDPGC